MRQAASKDIRKSDSGMRPGMRCLSDMSREAPGCAGNLEVEGHLFTELSALLWATPATEPA